jgi:hypothetical protein
MRNDTFACPACGIGLCRSPALGPGDTVMCPRCGDSFAYPGCDEDQVGLSGSTPSTATTACTLTPAAASKPIIEEEDEDHPRPVRPPIELDLTADRPLNLPECFRLAREHWSSILRPHALFCLGYLFLAFVLTVPCIGLAIAFLLVPLLHAGLLVVAMAQLKGRWWDFDDFGGGFDVGPSLVGISLYTLFLGVLLIPAGLVVGLVQQATRAFTPPDLYIAIFVLVGGLVGPPLFVWLYVRLFTFAVPLVLERNFTASDALAMSWHLTKDRFWPLLGLHLQLGLLNVAGALCFGVGLLATLPFTALVRTAAYLQVAGVDPPRSLSAVSRAEEKRYDAF